MAREEIDRPDPNALLLREVERNDRIGHLECTYIIVPVQLGSYEIKRVYTRFFESASHNIFLVSIRSRNSFSNEKLITTAEAAIKANIEETKALFATKRKEADTLCLTHGITPTARFLSPMSIDVRVIAPLLRQYLDLLVMADQLIGLLDTLSISGLVEMARATQEKQAIRSKVRRLPGYMRDVAVRMIKAASEMAAQTPTPGAKRAKKAAPPNPKLSRVDTDTDDEDEKSDLRAAGAHALAADGQGPGPR
jgi:hypothetical protein